MDEERKVFVKLNPEDVFLSYLSNENDCDNGNNLNVITYSFPGLQSVYQFKLEVNKRLGELKESGNLNKDSFKEVFYEVKKEHLDPDEALKKNSIVIGNYRLVRESSTSDWTFTEVGQANIKDVMPKFFQWTWKARLSIHAKTGLPFLSILRADLISNLVILSLILFLSTFPPLLGGLK